MGDTKKRKQYCNMTRMCNDSTYKVYRHDEKSVENKVKQPNIACNLVNARVARENVSLLCLKLFKNCPKDMCMAVLLRKEKKTN